MKKNKAQLISDILRLFQDSNIRYILLRSSVNYNKKILTKWKDVDILVHPNDRLKADKILKKKLFIVDPRLSQNTYLYGVIPFRYYRNFFYQLSFDVCYQLTCQSLNNNEICPLHKDIQNSAFENAQYVDDLIISLSDYDSIIYDLANVIFNKKGNSDILVNIKNKIKNINDIKEFKDQLTLVFFNFTPKLIDIIQSGKLDSLYEEYIKHRDY